MIFNNLHNSRGKRFDQGQWPFEYNACRPFTLTVFWVLTSCFKPFGFGAQSNGRKGNDWTGIYDLRRRVETRLMDPLSHYLTDILASWEFNRNWPRPLLKRKILYIKNRHMLQVAKTFLLYPCVNIVLWTLTHPKSSAFIWCIVPSIHWFQFNIHALRTPADFQFQRLFQGFSPIVVLKVALRQALSKSVRLFWFVRIWSAALIDWSSTDLRRYKKPLDSTSRDSFQKRWN